MRDKIAIKFGVVSKEYGREVYNTLIQEVPKDVEAWLFERFKKHIIDRDMFKSEDAKFEILEIDIDTIKYKDSEDFYSQKESEG